MYFVKRNPDFRTVFTIVRCYSLARKSHYDVLNLRKNCTDKEIKQAFIRMSKEYHPDKNKDVKAQEKFIRITEAYNTLSKPGSRAQYDMSEMDSSHSSPYVYRSAEAYNYRYNNRYSQYYDSHRTSQNKKEQQTAYYGVKGIKKVPNLYIIILCFGVAFVGTLMQVFVIRELYVIHRQQAMQRSKLLAEELDRVRAAARRNPNEVQTRLLLERIVGAANPTVATASMGQALANDKKAHTSPNNAESQQRSSPTSLDENHTDVRDSLVEPLLTEYGVHVVQSDVPNDLNYPPTNKINEDVTLYDLVRALVTFYYRGS